MTATAIPTSKTAAAPVLAVTPPLPAFAFPGLSCILCGHVDTVHLDLGSGDFTCTDCDETFDRTGVEGVMRQWCRVLKLLDLAATIPA